MILGCIGFARAAPNAQANVDEYLP